MLFIFDRSPVARLIKTAYMQAAPVLHVHIWAGIFISLGIVSSKWFINENLQKFILYRSLVGTVINIALNNKFT